MTSTLLEKIISAIYANKSIGMLFRSPFYLSSKTKHTLYYSLIYLISPWSSTHIINLSRIYCLQMRAVRAITNSDYESTFCSCFVEIKNVRHLSNQHVSNSQIYVLLSSQPVASIAFQLVFFTNSQIHGCYNC